MIYLIIILLSSAAGAALVILWQAHEYSQAANIPMSKAFVAFLNRTRRKAKT